MALKEIDELIDNDIKSEITKFNPETNKELRTRFLGLKCSFMPIRDEQFTKLVENLIDNKDRSSQNKDTKALDGIEEG